MSETNQPQSAVPKAIGPWTIESRVGSGGMGVVYRATRGDFSGRIAALKVIRPGLLEDEAVQARFAREVEVLRRVRDVHISEFLDADITGEPAWLATAFIDGANLRDYVSSRGPLPEKAWWALARGLAQALAVLEVHAITHRDMKPANVIMAEHGPVLIDFGIAVPEDAASLTGTGLVTGSPAWLSPEQANLQEITVSSDIFSLGSLLAFAGTGRPPFGTGAHVAVLLAIATREPDTGGLSDEQQRLLANMMAKDPANRPSARQVLQWTKTGAVDIPAATADTSSATQVLRPNSAAGTVEADNLDATTVAPMASAALAAAPTTAPVPTVAPPDSGEPRSKRRWLPILAVILGVLLLGGWWFSRGPGEDGSPLRPQPQASETPTPGSTPAAPAAGTAATSGNWVLSGWSIDNNASGQMSVAGTMKNKGAAAATGYATVYIYGDGVPIGTAAGQLPEIPAGGEAEVVLVGADNWAPGEKTVSLDVQ